MQASLSHNFLGDRIYRLSSRYLADTPARNHCSRYQPKYFLKVHR